MKKTHKKHLVLALLAFLSIVFSSFSIAFDDDMAVDQADSFDMESFHKDDKSSGVFKDDAKEKTAQISVKAQSKHSVSDLFSLSPNIKGLSVSQIQHQLFTKMALICPNGWEKTAEKATKAGELFQLEYRFNCL